MLLIWNIVKQTQLSDMQISRTKINRFTICLHIQLSGFLFNYFIFFKLFLTLCKNKNN